MKKILLMLLFLPLYGIAQNSPMIFYSETIQPGCIPSLITVSIVYDEWEEQGYYEVDYVKFYRSPANTNNWTLIQEGPQNHYQPPATTVSYKYSAYVNYTFYPYNSYSQSFEGNTYNTITKSIYAPLTSGGQIGSNQQLCPGVPAALYNITPPSGNGNAGTITYQWQVSSNGIAGWSNIPDATSHSLTLDYHSETKYYRRAASNNCTGSYVYSNVVAIEVGSFWSGGEIGRSQTICYNSIPSSLNNLAYADNPDVTYSWEYSLTGSGDWNTIQNENSTFLNISYALTQTRFYRRKATTPNCGYAYSNIVTINVMDELQGGDIGSDITICEGQSSLPISFEVLPSGGTSTGKTYIVQSSLNGISWTDELTVFDYPQNISFYPSLSVGSSYFRIKTVDKICGSVYSNTITYTLVASLTPNVIGFNQTIDYNTIPNQINTVYSASGGIGEYSYQWQSTPVSGGSWNNILGASDLNYQPNALTESFSYRVKVTDALCGTNPSNVVTIIVNPDLNPGAIGVEQLICNGTRPDTIRNTVDPSGGNGSYSYAWQRSPDAETWENISNSNFPYYRPVVLTEDAFFRRRVTSGSISKFTDHVHIAVDEPLAAPVVNGAGTFCRGTNVSLSVASPNPNFTYMWDFNGAYSLEGESITLDDLSQSFTINAFYINDIDCPSESTNVQVNADPVTADFYLTPTSANAGDRVSFFSTSVNAVEWAWDLGLGEIYTSQNPSVYFNVPGSYDIALTVTSPNDCADTKILEGALSVSGETSADALASTPLRIYPNPSKGVFFVDLDSAPKFDRIRVVSVSGAVVLDLPFEAFNGEISLDYAGVYLVQLLNGNSAFANAKIVKL